MQRGLFLLLFTFAATCKAQNIISSNDNLIIERPQNVSVSSPSNFRCELANPAETLTACQFESPNSGTYDVSLADGTVTNNGSQVAGVTGNDDGRPTKVCGIQIASITNSDIGDWVCKLTRANGATNMVKGKLNLRTSGDVPNVRLPASTIPDHYDISFVALWEPDWKMEGTFKMKGEVTKDGVNDNRVQFHFLDMSINEASIMAAWGVDEIPVAVTGHMYDFDREIYTVEFESPDRAVYDVAISGSYSAIITGERTQGYHYLPYMDRATNATKYMTMTEFEAADARAAFPCLDEPGFKATFTLSIGRRSDFVSVSNMPATSVGQVPVDNHPGYVWDYYPQTQSKMPTYLVAWAVSEFVEVVATPASNGIPVSTWTRADAVADKLADFATSISPSVLEYLEQRIGVAYGMPKMAQISYPLDSGGAMENWGLVTYMERDILIDMSLTSAEDVKRITNVIAHEYAHSWTGNWVTCAWWDSLWLNEAFATGNSYVAENAVTSYTNADKRFIADRIRYSMIYDGEPDSHPIIQTVDRPEDADFGTITYSKGGSIVRMMQHMLTEDGFFYGMYLWMRDREQSTSTPENMLSAMTSAAHIYGSLRPDQTMQTIMQAWLEKKNYPMVFVQRNDFIGTVTLTQSRFTYSAPEPGDDQGYVWHIPITWTLLGGDFNDTFPSDYLEPGINDLEIDIQFNLAPIIVNLQYTGFYRVNYDSANWQLLVDALANNHELIHVNNRAQMISDSYAFARAGIEPYTRPYDVVSAFLQYETEYLPIHMAVEMYMEMDSDLASLDPNGLVLHNYLELVLQSNYNAWGGIAEGLDDSFDDLLIKQEIVDAICARDLASCPVEAANAFAQWMAVPSNNPVNPNVRYAVYCSALRNGGRAEEDFLRAQLDVTYNPQEAHAIIRALDCTSSARKELKEAFEVIEASKSLAGHRDAVEILSRAVNDHQLKQRVVNFVQKRERELMRNFGKKANSILHQL